MPQPPAYSPSTDFSDEERDNVGGRSTVRTAALDGELSAIATTLSQVLTNLALVQRDDGEIRDGRVKLFTLASEVLALLTSYGATPRGAWLTGTAYGLKDLVSQSGNTYIVVSAHTSGVFATDLAAGKWLLFSLSASPGALQVTFTPTANVSATNVQAAIQEVDSEYRAADVTLQNNINTANEAATTALAGLVSDLANTASAIKGDALLGVKKVGVTGARATTQHAVNEARTVDATVDFAMATGASRATNDAELYKAVNSGARTIFIPNGTYLLSAKLVIAAAALGIRLKGEDMQNTVLSWQIDAATVNKFGLLLDAFVRVENLTLENTGNDLTNSAGLVSYTPTTGNGMRNGLFRNVRLKGWAVGVGASIDGLALSLVRSQAFSNHFEGIEFDGCGRPISLGAGANNNIWLRPAFLNNKGNRHIYLSEGSSNLFLSAQFEPVDASVTVGMLNAELVRSPNNIFLNPYLEPCYGFIADASPGTIIDSPLIEGFDFTVGTLSSSAILRSSDVSNAGVYSAPMFNHVRTPACRAAVNPVSYVASDDNTNTVTLVDGFTTRDANFKLKPAGQTSKLAVNTQGTFTPTLIGSTAGGAGNTYSQQAGQWIRVGNLVTAWFRIAITAKDGALAGNAQIGGLPLNVANLSQYGPAGSLSEFFVDLSAGYTTLMCEGVANSARLSLIQGGDNVAVLALPVAGINATTVLIGQITYITDAA